jgi:response regulator RpfG family c-di-GMP phosphodiesterase
MQAMEGVPVPETVQFVVQMSANFIITPKMMFLDEETTQKPLKDIETLDVTLAKIPTKVFYKLQVSVAQEIQSRARANETNLQVAWTENLSMKESLNLEVQQKEREQQKVEEMENQIHMLFQAIPKNTNEEARSSEEKLQRIERTLQQYKHKIKELEERVTPTTPPEVRA